MTGESRLADADLDGDRGRGERVVAGDYDDPDPGGLTAGHRVGHLGPGRVHHRGQAEEAQVPFGVLAVPGRRAAQVTGGKGQHPEPAGGVGVDHAGEFAAGPRVQGPDRAAGVLDGGAARQDRLRGALGVHAQHAAAAVDGGHELERRVEMELGGPGRLPAGRVQGLSQLGGVHPHAVGTARQSLYVTLSHIGHARTVAVTYDIGPRPGPRQWRARSDNARSRRVRRQGLEPRTRGLRVGCSESADALPAPISQTKAPECTDGTVTRQYSFHEPFHGIDARPRRIGHPT